MSDRILTLKYLIDIHVVGQDDQENSRIICAKVIEKWHTYGHLNHLPSIYYVCKYWQMSIYAMNKQAKN